MQVWDYVQADNAGSRALVDSTGYNSAVDKNTEFDLTWAYHQIPCVSPKKFTCAERKKTFSRRNKKSMTLK